MLLPTYPNRYARRYATPDSERLSSWNSNLAPVISVKGEEKKLGEEKNSRTQNKTKNEEKNQRRIKSNTQADVNGSIN